MSFHPPAFDSLLKPPRNPDLAVGLIGAGYIAEIGHIPAFMKAGYRIAAVADSAEKRRQYSQDVLGLKPRQVFADHRSLLDLPDIQIVDITIPQSSPHKIPILHDAIDAGKHILVEKPLSIDYQEAKEVVEHARRARVKIAICHQYRWMPVFRAAKNLIDQDYLGSLFFLSIDERRAYDYPEKYYNTQERWLLYMNAIHFIDEFRWWTGREPRSVYASLARRPGQYARGEMIGTVVLNFDDHLQATYVANDASFPQSQHFRFRLEGTGGIALGNFDDLFSAGELEYSPAGDPSFWYRPVLEGKCFPDGFAGLLGDLMDAIVEDRPPLVSGADNLKTMQIVFAAYRSAAEQRAVSPAEIDPQD